MNAQELLQWYAAGGRWFVEVDLYRADLRNADLSNANLRNANLRNANLYSVNLAGANLYGANLYGAYLFGVNLRDAKYIWQCGPSGADASILTANMHADGIRVYRGSFGGTLSEFITDVQKKATDNIAYYKVIIELLKVQEQLWKQQKKSEDKS